MSKKNEVQLMVPDEVIVSKIYLIRKLQVMLDRDLAILYGVDTKVLKQQIRRNMDSFPEDFMFELTKKELKDWRSQFVTSSSDKKGLRYSPFAFTEHGVLMLSSVLKSKRARQVNIQIMRTYVQLRKMAANYKEIIKKLEEMEADYGMKFKEIYASLKYLLNPPQPPRKRIGFNLK